MVTLPFPSVYGIWQAEKLYTKSLPFPHTSKEVFEQSIRMPIGPEFNPATAVGALNRPEVSASLMDLRLRIFIFYFLASIT